MNENPEFIFKQVEVEEIVSELIEKGNCMSEILLKQTCEKNKISLENNHLKRCNKALIIAVISTIISGIILITKRRINV